MPSLGYRSAGDAPRSTSEARTGEPSPPTWIIVEAGATSPQEAMMMPARELVGLALVALVVLAIVTGVGALAMQLRPAVTATSTPTSTVRLRPSHATRPTDQPCRAALQAEVDAAAAGSSLDLRGCTYAGGAKIDKPLTLIGATVHLSAGETGLTVTADDVTLDGLVLLGAHAAVFDFDEIGILVLGTPTAPIERLTIRGCEIASLGGFAMYLHSVADIRLEGNDVHDIVYAGLMILSGAGGTVEGNLVRRIGVNGAEANENNAYGIALTTQGDETPTSDFWVVGNEVEDVPTWHAFDTHGGRRIVFSGNTVRRSMRGIFVTTDGAGNEPTSITIVENRLLSPAPITSNLAAITLYRARTVSILRNTVMGWGGGNFLRDFEGRSTGVVLDQNTVVP
jgi:hypothetical protein